jgi:regulator of sigma E protease
VSWLLAFLGFALLIILHELGHFAVAKWVGMRVERFSLFFPPLLARKQRGETEYAVGAIPLGGYVKITGMNPHEDIPPEVEHRAYYKQPVWKRIAVIAAGPAVNIVLAFLILFVLLLVNGRPDPDADSRSVAAVERGTPAAATIKPGDELVAVDGKRGTGRELREQISSHKCAGKPTPGCQAAEPARLTVLRDGRELTFTVRPVYDAEFKRTRVGFSFTRVVEDLGPVAASGAALSEMWRFTSGTVTTIARILDPEKRKEISGVVGTYETTRQAVQVDLQLAVYILAVISLSLGVINLFPFLPLDGGHIFWALAEKVRGKAIPFAVLERAGFVGFALVMMLFAIGLSNDIGRLTGEGFQVR